LRKALPLRAAASHLTGARLMRYALLLIVVLLAFGMALAGGPNSVRGFTSVAVTRSAPELYAKNCASCHGRDGRGKTIKGKLKHARDLADSGWQDRVSDERIFNSVMNGKGKMPAYGKKISEPEIDALVSYVRALRK
jgi:mono/diheme cytochrome c family protein